MKLLLIALVICYVAWLGMLVVHELGHVVGALSSGGQIVSISVPLFGFSQSIVHPNPNEKLVVWCGPIIGVALPVIGALTCRFSLGRVPSLLLFFAGFCLIANGSYIGIGWIWHAGDAGDLLRLGTSRWTMVAFGVVATAIGFTLWHRTPFLTRRRAQG